MPEPRILVASALGKIIAPILEEAIDGALVTAACQETDIERAIPNQMRFDAVLIDLTWNDYRLEKEFDGLDVLQLLRDTDRIAPVIFAAQGHGVEREHLEEAILQPEVKCLIQKADGKGPLIAAAQAVSYGLPVPKGAAASLNQRSANSIYQFFTRPRNGPTLARIAGAIATGRATDAESLADATGYALNTVNKLTQQFGPMIKARGEHDENLRLTAQVVYRWCGEHSCYIRSWCRRNGQADVLGDAGS